MKDLKEHKILLKEFLICSMLVGTLNIIFFLLTKETGWFSDDYGWVFSTKLFNLINEQTFFIGDGFTFSETRFMPFFFYFCHFFLMIIFHFMQQ